MENIKTTATGVLTIVIAIADFALRFLKTGSIGDITATITAVTAGVGLILARDSR